MLATQNDPAVSQELQELKDRLRDARQRSDEIFSLVKPEFLYDRPIPERHRIIFYVGHLEAFDWNLLGERVFGLKSFHPTFDRLFAFGIDPVGGGLPNDQPADWPALKQVREYAAKTREILDDKIHSRTRQITRLQCAADDSKHGTGLVTTFRGVPVFPPVRSMA